MDLSVQDHLYYENSEKRNSLWILSTQPHRGIVVYNHHRINSRKLCLGKCWTYLKLPVLHNGAPIYIFCLIFSLALPHTWFVRHGKDIHMATITQSLYPTLIPSFPQNFYLMRCYCLNVGASLNSLLSPVGNNYSFFISLNTLFMYLCNAHNFGLVLLSSYLSTCIFIPWIQFVFIIPFHHPQV